MTGVGKILSDIRAEIDREAPIYEHFGRFIHSYAQMEAGVHLLFRYTTGMPDDAARAISGGMRLSDLMSMTKRMLKIRKFYRPVIMEVDTLFNHINEIAQLRDILVHRGIEIKPDEILSSNEPTAKSLEDVEILRINLKDIIDASTDCQLIFGRLFRASQERPSFVSETDMKEWSSQPWLYKPRKPDTPNRQPPRRRRLLGLLPPSSRP